MKKHWISSLAIALSVAALPIQADAARSDNLKTLFQEFFSDMILDSFTGQVVDALNLEIDPDTLRDRFREQMNEEPLFTQLAEPYVLFSDEEIAGLAALFTSPLYKKFSTEGTTVIVANFETIQTALSDLAMAGGTPTPKIATQPAPSGVIEVTSENFAAVVEQSDKPLIIDVYAPWCGPCKKLSPILEKASERYPGIRFVKVNCDTEQEVAGHYKVRSLPTLLFVLPGESDPSMKSVGLLTEQALEAKIAEFQKLFY